MRSDELVEQERWRNFSEHNGREELKKENSEIRLLISRGGYFHARAVLKAKKSRLAPKLIINNTDSEAPFSLVPILILPSHNSHFCSDAHNTVES